jgi:hypothetical protein
MSDSFKFQAKFPDIGLRGILKDISVTVGWFNLHETEPGQIYKRKTTGTDSVSCTETNRSQTHFYCSN